MLTLHGQGSVGALLGAATWQVPVRMARSPQKAAKCGTYRGAATSGYPWGIVRPGVNRISVRSGIAHSTCWKAETRHYLRRGMVPPREKPQIADRSAVDLKSISGAKKFSLIAPTHRLTGALPRLLELGWSGRD